MLWKNKLRCHFLIGYPDELLNDEKLEELYKNLEFNDENFLKNKLKLARFELDYEINEFGKPYNKSNWVHQGLVAIVDAFYYPQGNSISMFWHVMVVLIFSSHKYSIQLLSFLSNTSWHSSRIIFQS